MTTVGQLARSGIDLVSVSEGLSARLREACNFRPEKHLPLALAGARIGWLRPDLAERLRDWPDLFRISPDGVGIRGQTENELTSAFAEVAARLAKDGAVRGWRGETYAVRADRAAQPAFHLERAAMRFFGFTSSAAHLSGFTGKTAWIARRAASKSIDPGMLDNLVAGGVASGQDAWQTLLRECGEEAGIARELAQRAERKGVLQVCREVPDGVHSEVLIVHDLELPADFVPRNADGEVSEFLSLAADAVLERVARGEMTIEAGLVAVDFVQRRGLVQLDAAALQALRKCQAFGLVNVWMP